MMKKSFFRVLSVILALILVVSTVPFSMAETSGYGDSPLKIEISSNKNSYKAINTAKFTVTVKNISDDTVENVSVETIFDGLVPVGMSSQLSKEVEEIEAGESISFSFDAMLDTEKVSTNFFSELIIKIIKLFKGEKAIVENDFNDGRLYAEDIAEITFGDANISQVARVWYSAGVDLTVNQSNIETTELEVTLDGIASSEVGIESVKYEIASENDTTNTVTTGYALISGDEWSANIQLKTGRNTITITAVNYSGTSKSVTVDAYYDIGELAQYSADDVVTNDEGTAYFDGAVAVYFDSDISDAMIRDFIENQGGIVTGVNNFLNLYQVDFRIEDYDELAAKAEELTYYSGVVDASVEEIIFSVSDIPNDPWDRDVSASDWTDNDVDGSNWGLEAIEAEGAWAYNDRLAENPARIGVIDGGFDYSNEDFTEAGDNVNFHVVETGTPNPVADYSYVIEDGGYEYVINDNTGRHGSHVTGTIAAAADNNKGVTGIVWNADVFLATIGELTPLGDGYSSFGWTSSAVDDAITRAVIDGAKVINYSGGYSFPISTDYYTRLAHTESFVKTVSDLLDEGFDFLFVQSAGNNGIDALRNGTACSLSSDLNIYSITGNHSAQDIMDRTIVVAAAENTTSSRGYRLAYYSNYGDRIDVAAPGSDIYSAYEDSDYGYMNGTSMAAPHVTAVASLVWSINRNFTAPMVKELVCSPATTTTAYGHEETKSGHDDSASNYRMLNARMAVEEAIRITDAEGIATGRFVDAETGYGISYGTFTIYKETMNGERFDDNVYTFTDGYFEVELPAGKYVLKVEAEGFVIKYATIIVEPFETIHYGDIPVTRTLSENQMRIVLSWGEVPRDLDSHIVGMTNSGSPFHVAYYNRNFYDSYGEPLVWLDVDDVSSYGPETVTLVDLDEIDEFTYCIHNYTERSATETSSGAYSLSDSGAKIDVYKGNEQIASYNVPTNRKGTVWNVFSFDSNGIIRRINTFEFESDPDYVGYDFYFADYYQNNYQTQALPAGKKKAYEK